MSLEQRIGRLEEVTSTDEADQDILIRDANGRLDDKATWEANRARFFEREHAAGASEQELAEAQAFFDQADRIDANRDAFEDWMYLGPRVAPEHLGWPSERWRRYHEEPGAMQQLWTEFEAG